MYDVTRRETYERVMKWKEAFESATQAENIPIVIIGNKVDMGSKINPYLVK